MKAVAALAFLVLPNEAVNVRSTIRTQRSSISASRMETATRTETAAEVAASLHLHERSKAEIMAEMTLEKAHSEFTSMDHSSANRTIVEFIQRRISEKRLRTREDSQPTGYAAVDGARDMLNSMMDEAIMKKELEGVRCSEFDNKQLKILMELEQDIAFVNSEASGARAEVLRAQQVIQVVEEVKLPTTSTALAQHNERCRIDLEMLKQQLAIVLADAEVMKGILKMVCADVSSKLFLQVDESVHQMAEAEVMADGEMVKCVSCGRQTVWLRHNRVQPMLAKLRSEVAKAYLQDNLNEEFGMNEHRAKTVLIDESETIRHYNPDSPCDEAMKGENGQGYRGCQVKTQSGRLCQKWNVQSPHKHDYTEDKYPDDALGNHNFCRNPAAEKESIWCFTTDPEVPWELCDALPALEAPTGVTKHECKETNACKLGPGQCTKLRDRFLNILSGILDKKEELSNSISMLDDSCAEIRAGYENTLSALGAQLKEEQTALASAYESLSENMQQSALSNEQHQTLHKEYSKTMTECCDTKNQLTAEICALEKIRGELYKIEGVKVFMADCEVSEWADEECTVSCGGGKQRRTRSIMIHPVNGAKCPPLEMERSCNLDGCPIDCKVDDWGGWGDCSADCGGGVQSRSRPKTVEPENGGLPCPEQQESRDCNGFACNADCELKDWSDWSLCSKACGGGHNERTRSVLTEPRGLGTCEPADSESRLGFGDCNTFSCMQLVQSGRSTLVCQEMIDLIIVLDGSGSLGSYGWQESQSMAVKLVDAMQGGDNGVNLALLLFSGPWTWESYYKCTGQTLGEAVTAEECGVTWESHLTGEISEVKKAAEALTWPARTTLTSYALAEAKNELINGRQDAKSIVIVITDGKPMSNLRTATAAEEVKKLARLIWIPVGYGVKSSIENMKSWASQPWEDNLMIVDEFSMLDTPTTINNMVSEFCTSLLFEETTTTASR